MRLIQAWIGAFANGVQTSPRFVEYYQLPGYSKGVFTPYLPGQSYNPEYYRFVGPINNFYQ
jgi:hypothetical protein